LTQATTVDFAAVARVSRYSELKDIRLTEVSAKCDPKSVGALKPEFSHSSSLAGHTDESIEVSCAYHFVGRTAETQAIDVSITYLVIYTLKAKEPIADEDIAQFAASNGTLHSWPFVREFLHGLTSRMGFPPFKLGVMHFVPLKPPKPAKKPPEGQKADAEQRAESAASKK
jgi:preprotein translocase subunit SecB